MIIDYDLLIMIDLVLYRLWWMHGSCDLLIVIDLVMMNDCDVLIVIFSDDDPVYYSISNYCIIIMGNDTSFYEWWTARNLRIIGSQ